MMDMYFIIKGFSEYYNGGCREERFVMMFWMNRKDFARLCIFSQDLYIEEKLDTAH